MSVRNAAEAAVALAGGADVIDVKEPRNGPLGRASPPALTATLREVAGRAPVTAAWGELREGRSKDLADLPPGLAALKLGLAGAQGSDWRADLDRTIATVSHVGPEAHVVVAAYADHAAADAPPPEAALAWSAAAGRSWMVLDTFHKGPSQNGSTQKGPAADDLLATIGVARLRGLIDTAAAGGVGLVLAGSLRGDPLKQAAKLLVHGGLVGVRGAACEGGRLGRITAEAVAAAAGAAGATPERLVR